MYRKYTLAIAFAALPSLVSAEPVYDPYSDAEPTLSAAVKTAVPFVGERRSITAGEELIVQRNVRKGEGVRLDELVTSPPKNTPFTLQSGDFLYRVRSKVALKACAITFTHDGLQPCLLDDNGDGLFDRAALNSMSKANPMDKPARYTKTSVQVPPATPGLTRSMIYQGLTSDGLKLSYREFSEDLARPAFSEDISVPLMKEFPQRFAVKGAIVTLFAVDALGSGLID